MILCILLLLTATRIYDYTDVAQISNYLAWNCQGAQNARGGACTATGGIYQTSVPDFYVQWVPVPLSQFLPNADDVIQSIPECIIVTCDKSESRTILQLHLIRAFL